MVEALKNALPAADRVDILTAFFYFSGFRLIADELKDKKIRILVGKYIDPSEVGNILAEAKNDTNFSLEKYEHRGVRPGRIEQKELYTDGFINLFNRSYLHDDTEDQHAYKIFEKKLRDGTLEIKLCSEQNHAKQYILHNKPEMSQGGDAKGSVFFGSSNFTFQGLKGQGELNQAFRDNKDFDEHSIKFENLWESAGSIDIQTMESNNDFLQDVEKKIWIHATPDPYKIYIRILHEIFGNKSDDGIKTPASITEGQFGDLRYQLDAIRDGIDCIDRHDGVIIADVVGLGKSVIASAIAHNIDMRQTVIIAPPHINAQWNEYVTQFGLRGAQVHSSGKIEAIHEQWSNTASPALFIIDEAHRYRNELTDDYQRLHQIVRSHPDNKVILLTATPFNNRPEDVFALIKLFQTPSRSTINSVDNLSLRFRELVASYKNLQKIRRAKGDPAEMFELADKISAEMRRLIEPVVIRRSRVDLREDNEYAEDLRVQNIDFSEVVGPELMSYDLGSLTGLYLDTLQKITGEDSSTGFTGARYKPATYISDREAFIEAYGEYFDDSDLATAQTNLAKFMRKLLVTRFESSKFAFKSTLHKMIESNRTVVRWWETRQQVPILKKGEIPDPDTLELDEDDDVNNILDSVDIGGEKDTKQPIAIDANLVSEEFIRDVRSDIELLEDIERRWFGDGQMGEDPKLDGLKKEIDRLIEENPKRKIVVFSGYSDTATYLYNSLIEKGTKRVMLYTGSTSSVEQKKIVRANFDAGIEPGSPNYKDDYDIIIATDALSEGFSLHRAGVVINYDIPYNPTRVIQRIGRINRINKKVFDKIYIYNCFPTAVGEAETNIKEVSTLKILLINNIVGTDTKTLTPDEEVKSIWKKQYQEADAVNNELSWEIRHRNVYNAVKNNPGVIDEALRIPERTRIVRTNQADAVAISFAQKGNGMLFALSKDEAPAEIMPTDVVLDYFVAEEDEKSQKGDSILDKRFAVLREKLIAKHPQPNIRGARAEALNLIEFLVGSVPSQKDYLIDLQNTIKEYDDLSDGELKFIAQIKPKDSDEGSLMEVVELIKVKITPHYLASIRKRAERNENEDELIMFTEDLRI